MPQTTAVPASQADSETTKPVPQVLLTVEDAAEMLGIGRTLLYSLIRTGAITSVRIGRLRRLRPADIDAFAARLRPAA
ncbi:helix-turn-helix domain-containing protein [Parafrankia sp. FMc6]|uniref:helix-turn-helix domain-containing protein n=1 Tax=Parafrankia soli TaxID=2599596 RepID=UPI0034D4B929